MDVDFRHSIICGASCWLAAVLAFYLHLDSPWWAVISAWILAAQDSRATLEKAGLRVAGTLAGFVVAFLALRCTDGNILGEAGAMFLIGASGTYQRFRSRFSYAWIIGAVTALMLMTLGIENPETAYENAHYRVYEILTGVFAATAGQWLLWPVLRLPAGPAGPSTAAAAAPLSPRQTQELIATAVVGGALPIIILLLWSRFNLPSPLQIIITAFITIDRDVVTTRLRANQRILGCLFGGAGGLFIVSWGIDSIVLWSLVLISGIICFSRLHLEKKHPSSYIGTQGGVAFIMALVTGNNPPDSILPVVNRVAGMLSGVLLLHVLCVILRIWRDQLPEDAAA